MPWGVTAQGTRFQFEDETEKGEAVCVFDSKKEAMQYQITVFEDLIGNAYNDIDHWHRRKAAVERDLNNEPEPEQT